MSSNNTPDGKPPKKPAKAKTSKPRTSKAKSTATVLGVDPNTIDEPMRTLNSEYKPADAGIPTSANSPNLVHGSGQWNGELNTEVCSTQEADSQKSVPDSQVETQHTPKEQTPTQSSTQPDPTEDAKNTGDVANPVLLADGIPGPELLESIPRARLTGEKRHAYWERMRKAARLAGLPRGQGAGSAYVWATQQAELEFPYVSPVIVEELPDDSDLKPAEPTSDVLPAEVVSQKTVEETARVVPAADLGVSGLGEIPESWPSLPANAQLQVEIAWVSANRLRVRSGSGVDLSRALSPAPSYSALSWLETSILFPAKFADISVKATVDQDDEREFIKREKLAIDEIRSILKEMLDAKS